MKKHEKLVTCMNENTHTTIEIQNRRYLERHNKPTKFQLFFIQRLPPNSQKKSCVETLGGGGDTLLV